MELRTLRYFVATADAGSVNAAAPIVHVTQPAISRQLTQLQRELGITLFDTRGARSTLTAAGRQFLPIARDLLIRAEKASEAAASFAAGRLQSISISAPATTLNDVIAPFLATWGPSDPTPSITEADATDAASALLDGADLAIVTANSGTTRPFTTTVALSIKTKAPETTYSVNAIADLPIWVYVRSDHRWAGRTSVHVHELVDEAVISMTPEFKPRRILDSALAQAGLSVTNLMESSNTQVAQALAAAGRGVAIVSDDPRFGLIPLALEGVHGPVRIGLFAAWDPRHHAHNKLEAIADRLKTFCEERYGPGVRPQTVK